MAGKIESHDVLAMAPGTTRSVVAHRFGLAEARPRVYLQAALHADELPGALILHHLIERLGAAEAAGEIAGHIVIVPLANPLGLAQHVYGYHLGRFDLNFGANYNRRFPDLVDAIARRIAARLGDDPAANVALIREAADAALDEQRAVHDLQALRILLMRLAIDADMVFDLHCAMEAVLYLSTSRRFWPRARDLAADIGAEAVLLSAGLPRAEASFPASVGGIWPRLARRFAGRFPIPDIGLTATIEYRGRREVDDRLAAADADNLVRFLRRRGALRGEAPAPAAFAGQVSATAEVATVHARRPGLIVYHRGPGERVAAGEPVCSIVDPNADTPEARRQQIVAPCDGLIFARHIGRLATPGVLLFRIAGGPV